LGVIKVLSIHYSAVFHLSGGTSGAKSAIEWILVKYPTYFKPDNDGKLDVLVWQQSPISHFCTWLSVKTFVTTALWLIHQNWHFLKKCIWVWFVKVDLFLHLIGLLTFRKPSVGGHFRWLRRGKNCQRWVMVRQSIYVAFDGAETALPKVNGRAVGVAVDGRAPWERPTEFETSIAGEGSSTLTCCYSSQQQWRWRGKARMLNIGVVELNIAKVMRAG
jgi:hypothetical protein